MACQDGLAPTDVDTQTYLFLRDVLRQANNPSGFPSAWINASGATVFPADYEMDPQILSDSRYRSQLSNALAALPSLSLVMDQSDLFGSKRPVCQRRLARTARGDAPLLELIHPDGRPGFKSTAASPHPHVVRKRSLNLYFQFEFGPGKLHYPLFADAPLHGDSAVDEFDRLVLRAGQNDSWQSTSYQGNSARFATYTRDQMVRDTLLSVAGFGGHGTYTHLYLNGFYWGLYNLVERPDDNFDASYFGGADTNWFAVNMGGRLTATPRASTPCTASRWPTIWASSPIGTSSPSTGTSRPSWIT